MLVVLSPAKSLDFSKISGKDFSIPEFLNEAEILIKLLRKLKPGDLSALMGISAKLADLNFSRFLKWDKNHNLENSKPAIYTFNGDVYEGLMANTLDNESIDFLEKNTRILSGLYGVLHPLDSIMEYRLEMGIKLPNKKGQDLYKFWGKKIAQTINKAIENSDGEKVLVNLASNEYFKSIDRKSLKYPVLTPVFKEYKDGDYQMISFFAKKARGLMTRYISLEKLNTPEDLKKFNLGGYSYNKELSSAQQLFFTR